MGVFVMNRGKWLLAVLVVCAALVAGCANTPGDGTGLEGKWTGSLAVLFTIFDIDLPVKVAPEAKLLFDDGALTITLQPGIPVIGWLFRVVIDGSYTDDTSGSLDKMTLSLGKASAKFLFFTFPLKDLGVATQCIYTIKAQNTLYILPAYDKIPEAARLLLEASPQSIPWDGITIDGVTYTPLKLSRDL
jgi:predicted small secreted protein